MADPDGTRAKNHYTRLNKWGLFDTPTDAKQYLDFIFGLVSGKRTEGIDYIAEGIDYIAEIRAVGNRNSGAVEKAIP